MSSHELAPVLHCSLVWLFCFFPPVFSLQAACISGSETTAKETFLTDKLRTERSANICLLHRGGVDCRPDINDIDNDADEEAGLTEGFWELFIRDRLSEPENDLLLEILISGSGNREDDLICRVLLWEPVSFLLALGDTSPAKNNCRCRMSSLSLRNNFSSERLSFSSILSSFSNSAASCAFRKSKVFALFFDNKVSARFGFIFVRYVIDAGRSDSTSSDNHVGKTFH